MSSTYWMTPVKRCVSLIWSVARAALTIIPTYIGRKGENRGHEFDDGRADQARLSQDAFANASYRRFSLMPAILMPHTS